MRRKVLAVLDQRRERMPLWVLIVSSGCEDELDEEAEAG